jgi:MFS family permease
VAASFLVALCFFQVSTTLPVAMSSRGLSPRDFGLLVAMNGLLIVAAQPAAMALVSRARRSRSLALGAALLAVGFGSHALAHSASGYAAGIVLWTAGELACASLVPAVVADLSTPQLRGSYQGALMFAHGAAAFLGPLAGGLLLAHGGHAALWLSCAAAASAAALVHLACGPSRARRLAHLGRSSD